MHGSPLRFDVQADQLFTAFLLATLAWLIVCGYVMLRGQLARTSNDKQPWTLFDSV